MIAAARKLISTSRNSSKGLTALAVMALMNAMTATANAGSHSLYILDANTGATLTDQDSNGTRYPASLTKMMTLYLAFEAVEQDRVSMKTKIRISQAAANAAPSKLDLAPGDEIALEDAIMALITKSANDIAIAIAEHLGGTESNFAKLMTAKARELGMKSTTFQNASGLPNSSQITTARDMATLGLRLYDDHPRYFPLFSTRSYNYNGSTFRNHNTLMLQMPGINGIKTGYTHASGFNLVSSLQADGKHVIGAIFGGETAGSRNAQMRVALTRAMAKASAVKTRKPVLLARAEAKAAEQKAADKKAKAAVLASIPAAKPKSVPVPAPAAASPVEPATAKASPAPTGLKIDVAKVRTNDVAASRQPQVSQAQTASPHPAKPVPEPFAQASLIPQPHPATPATLPAGTRAPSSFESQMAGLAQNMQRQQPGTAEAVTQPVSLPVEPVRQPSSLNAQLAGLTQGNGSPGMALPTYRLKGPESAAHVAALAPPAAAAATQSAPAYEIQIGAYATAAEADRQLSQVQSQTPVLKGYTPARRSVKLGDKMLHRARFAGFDQAGAQAMCAELIRQKINCLALKGE